ncbi:MAG: TetR family transcriptional regulator [Myxococcota bacterium]
MGWQRARSPEQKAARRGTIVAAGARLLEQAAMSDVSLNAIAREAGLAKSNLYRYFATREEIFLALLTEDVEDWAQRNETAVLALPDEPAPDELARVLVGCMIHRPRMIRLLGQLVSVLECNSSVEAIVEFKLRVKALGERQAEVIASKLRWLTPEAAMQLTHFQMALLQGMWPYHEPPDNLVEALRHPDLEGMHMPLEPALERAMTVMIRGLAAEAG